MTDASLLESILERLDEPIYAADMDTYEVVYANGSLRRAFGDVVGKTCYKVLQGQDSPCAFCTNSKLLDRHGRPTGIHRWQFDNARNGRTYDLQDSALEWNGRRIRMEVARDITDERRWQASATLEHDLLAAISDAQRAFIATGDRTTLFDDLLAAVLRLTRSEYGFIGETLPGTPGKPVLRLRAFTDLAWDHASRELAERFSSDGMDLDNPDSLLGAVLTTRAPVVANDPAADPRRAGTPPGHPPLRSFLGLPLLSGGELVGMVGVANREGGYPPALVDSLSPLMDTCGAILHALREERDRKAAEMRLRERQAFVENIINAITHPLYVINADTHEIIEANRAAAVPARTRPATCYKATHDRDEPCYGEAGECPLDMVKRTRRPAVVEHTHTGDDGSTRIVEVHMYPLFDENGEIHRVIEYALDLTETRNLQAQVAQAQKMDALGRLAGGVAHDFNNLLSAMMGFSELAVAQLHAGHQARQAMDTVVEAGQRAANLTRQLLMFSRKQVLQAVPLDLGKVVRDAATLLGRLLGAEVKLRVDVDDGVPRVMADPTQVTQALLNLAVNARDAMPQGGEVRVRVSARSLDGPCDCLLDRAKNGPHVVIDVTDTGAGIPREALGRLFEPFFTTKSGKGIGLGLSTVYGVVHQHRGHVHVNSESGRGTTFTLAFPVTADALVETRPPAARQAPVTSLRVLVVEDEPMVRMLCSTLLRRAGHVVKEAAHADDALRILQREPDCAEVVLSDVEMPGRSGVDLAVELGRRRPDLKVVLMSGYAETLVERYGVRAGEFPFVAKPFSAEALLRVIEAACLAPA
ncbi:MAG: GAF domain-containing protein [Deltaproteobacteria bacterium]|nr:GAF domain-containing protein [Deltaproteobacteria bacterium]